MAKLIERTHQSKNCYCLKEAYIGGGTDGREPGENHEKFSLLFDFSPFDDGWYCARANVSTSRKSRGRSKLHGSQLHRSQSLCASTWGRQFWRHPGATQPGYMWREQRAGEDWRNNTWREQRTYEDVRTNSWRQERAKEDWQQRQKIEKEKVPNNATETGYLNGCPTGAPTSTCQSNPAGSINASGATNAAGATELWRAKL